MAYEYFVVFKARALESPLCNCCNMAKAAWHLVAEGRFKGSYNTCYNTELAIIILPIIIQIFNLVSLHNLKPVAVPLHCDLQLSAISSML